MKVMDRQLREEYIKAYQFYYGESRKKALESFKQRIDSGEQDTIVLLIDGYHEQCKLAFYYD